METTIVRKDGMNLELWIKDLGDFDPYQVFMDGVQVDVSFQTEKHYTIPDGTTAILVQFNGADGGVSAVVDNQTPPVVLGKQTDGLTHKFTITAG